jgi:hypothetical protein
MLMISGVDEFITGKVDQNKFFKGLQHLGYNSDSLIQFLDTESINSIDILKFNENLQNIQKESGIKISDMVLILDKYFIDLKKIMPKLDQKTLKIIMRELSDEYFVGSVCGNLEELL